MKTVIKNLSEADQKKLKEKAMPEWMDPMLATLTHDYFSDPDWRFERKLDGERCLVFKKDGDVRLMSRNRKLQNDYFPKIANAVEDLQGNFILDCELVTFDGKVTSFSMLQNRMHVSNPGESLISKYPVYAYIFDILYLDGNDLTGLPLTERKKVLKSDFRFDDPLRLLPYKYEHGEKYLKKACKKGWEGLIAKEASGTYKHSRSRKWLKFKCGKGQEFVIGGYTEPKGERIGFGALLIGYYEEDKLKYAGKVGTGFDDAFLGKFINDLESKQHKTCPFTDFDDSTKGITWVTPHFV